MTYKIDYSSWHYKMYRGLAYEIYTWQNWSFGGNLSLEEKNKLLPQLNLCTYMRTLCFGWLQIAILRMGATKIGWNAKGFALATICAGMLPGTALIGGGFMLDKLPDYVAYPISGDSALWHIGWWFAALVSGVALVALAFAVALFLIVVVVLLCLGLVHGLSKAEPLQIIWQYVSDKHDGLCRQVVAVKN